MDMYASDPIRAEAMLPSPSVEDPEFEWRDAQVSPNNSAANFLFQLETYHDLFVVSNAELALRGSSLVL